MKCELPVEAHWFDGLLVPLVHYSRQEEVMEWFREASLIRVWTDPE